MIYRQNGYNQKVRIPYYLIPSEMEELPLAVNLVMNLMI